jgi:hypothetical protein
MMPYQEDPERRAYERRFRTTERKVRDVTGWNRRQWEDAVDYMKIVGVAGVLGLAVFLSLWL